MSVAAAIVEGDRVLAIRRRDNGKWEPPGGTLELGETILDGLRREVSEETGLEIRSPVLSGIYKNMPRGIVALVFRCEAEGQASTTDEVAEVKWMTAEEVGTHLDPAYGCRLLDALAFGTAAIRAHDGTKVLE